MNAVLQWLFVCLANHYADGYRHGYERAMADTQGIMAESIEKLADGVG